MAISQMKKISLIFSKETLDALLLAIQQSQVVQIRDMTQMDDWQTAFENEQVNLPQIRWQEANKELTGEEALSHLARRQQTLEATIGKLQHFIPKEGTIQSLRKPDFSMSFAELEAFGRDNSADVLINQVNNKIRQTRDLERRISEHQAEINRLLDWQALDVTPEELNHFDFVHGVIGTIPKTDDDALYHQLKANPALEVQDVFSSALEYGVIVFQSGQVSVALDDYGFKPFEYDKTVLPAQAISQMKEEVAAWTAQKLELEGELKVSQEELQALKVQTDYVLGLYARQEAKKKLASTKHLVALEGWVETDQVDTLKSEIEEQFGDSVFVQELDVVEDDWEAVPIKLKNHPLVEPFELVTEMYALPKYYEKDPTPILMPFYFTFFGMMVADLGYGLFLFLATFLALKFFNLPKGTKRFLKFFNILAVAVSLWGIIYGSFFGYTMPIVLLSTTTDVMTILLLSVAFGFVTVVVGLLLGGLQKLRMKDYAESYNSGFAWCLILIGILLIVLGNMLPGLSVLTTVGAVLAIANAVGIVIVSIIQAKSLVGLGSGLYNLYNISGYVGDLVSFTRLMALGLSGASIGSAFNLIVEIFPPVARFTIGIVIFILLHAINIFLSLLSGYVHGARLMFVEFFGKFYEGGGKPFQPLKSSEKYVKVTIKSQSEEN